MKIQVFILYLFVLMTHHCVVQGSQSGKHGDEEDVKLIEWTQHHPAFRLKVSKVDLDVSVTFLNQYVVVGSKLLVEKIKTQFQGEESYWGDVLSPEWYQDYPDHLLNAKHPYRAVCLYFLKKYHGFGDAKKEGPQWTKSHFTLFKDAKKEVPEPLKERVKDIINPSKDICCRCF